MIARLGELRRGTQGRALLGAYQAGIDRLEALAYRLENGGGRRVLGLSASPASAPKPAGGARAGGGRASRGGGDGIL